MLFKFIFIICVLLQMSCVINSSNILGVFTSPHRSHMLVYFGVVKGLLKRGHNITIVTVLPIQDMLQEGVHIVQLKKPKEAKRMHGIFRQIAIIAANSKAFEDPRFQQFLQENNRFDVVILGYLFNDYQLGLAAHFHCPIIVIWTTQLISYVNRFIGNPNGWSYVPQPFVSSQTVGLRGILYGIFDSIFQWILDILMGKVYRKYFPPDDYPSLAQMQKNVSLVLTNHHFSEGPISAHLPSVIEISGIQIDKNEEVPKTLLNFVDTAKQGVIYFSLGTVASSKQLKPMVLDVFFKVFSSLPQRVIWKIDSFPRNSSNIFLSKWLPQNYILNHTNTKLFITHGGKGSTTEALHYAVPMIAIPIFGDQFADAYRLKKNGFGLSLDADNITEAILGECIYEVLNNGTYEEQIRAASAIYNDRPLSSEETATYWIEYVIRHRGAPHMQTSTKHMNIIQSLNIDVYLFCFCFFNATVAFFNIIISTTYNQDLAQIIRYTCLKTMQEYCRRPQYGNHPTQIQPCRDCVIKR